MSTFLEDLGTIQKSMNVTTSKVEELYQAAKAEETLAIMDFKKTWLTKYPDTDGMYNQPIRIKFMIYDEGEEKIVEKEFHFRNISTSLLSRKILLNLTLWDREMSYGKHASIPIENVREIEFYEL